jgi:surface antigen
MRRSTHLALALACVATLIKPGSSAAAIEPAQYQPNQPNADCREFTMPVVINGRQEQATGRACRQPDGSWQVTQQAPGAPEMVYTLPPQAIYPSPYPYPYYWMEPWAFAPPFFVGGSILFADGFHRFHHRGFIRDRGHREEFHGGMHGGFHGGFHGGHR